MHTLKTWAGLLWIALTGGAAYAATEGELSQGMVNPGYHEKPAWFKLSFLDMREDVSEAAGAGKRVMLYFYQDGCPYCKKLLEDNFGNKEIADKTQKHFDTIAINMWGDREVIDLNGKEVTEKKFAEGLRVMFTPTLLFLDESGKVVVRVNGYFFPAKFSATLDYVAQKLEQKTTLDAYLQKVAPAASSGKLHSEPFFKPAAYVLDAKTRGSKKPLVVFFEQKVCAPCDELHTDILKRPETLAQIQHLDAVQLDMRATTPVVTPSGRKTTAAEWARELKVTYAPSLLFFDSEGKEVFRTEAYLRSFHIQNAMAYVHSGAYKTQPNFQRYLQGIAEEYAKKGIKLDIWQ